jgi:hypothetical protein
MLLEDSGSVLFRAATLDVKRKTDLNAELSYSGRHETNSVGDGMWKALTED